MQKFVLCPLMMLCCLSVNAATNELFPNDTDDGQWISDEAGVPSFIDEPIKAADKTKTDDEQISLVQHQELTHFGASELIYKRNSFGAGFGMEAIGRNYYALIKPELSLKFGDFSASLGAPLRISIFDLQSQNGALVGLSTAKMFSLRQQDWDQYEDYLGILRYVSWGRPGDWIFADIGHTEAISLGQGELVRVFSPDILIDQKLTFAQAKLNLDYVSAELFAGPFLVPHFFGASLIVRPFDKLPQNFLSSLGLTLGYVGNIKTPTSLIREKVSNADLLIIDPYYKITANYGVIHGGSVGLSATPIKVDLAELECYSNYSHLWFPSVVDEALAINSPTFHDGGLNMGALFKLSLGEAEKTSAGEMLKPKHAFRVRLEGNIFGSQFLPNYFDTFYEVQQYQFAAGDASTSDLSRPTKVGYLAQQSEKSPRLGFYTEFSYSLMDWFALTLMYQDALKTGDNSREAAAHNIALQFESTQIPFLQFLASYQVRNFQNFAQIFDPKGINTLLFLEARGRILPFLFVNGWLKRAFKIGFSPGEEDTIKTMPSGGTYRLSSIGMENFWLFGANVELALEF